MQTFFVIQDLFYLGITRLPGVISSVAKRMKQNSIFRDKLQQPWRKSDLIFFSPWATLHRVSPFNVKREIRGLQEAKKEKQNSVGLH